MLRKLIELGHIKSGSQDAESPNVTLLAMCGIHLGPVVLQSTYQSVINGYLVSRTVVDIKSG